MTLNFTYGPRGTIDGFGSRGTGSDLSYKGISGFSSGQELEELRMEARRAAGPLEQSWLVQWWSE